MRRLVWAIPVAFFFLNPSFACGPAEPQFEYGAAEMTAAVAGHWSFTILPQGADSPLHVTVKVEQASGAQALAPSHAPGATFVRAAHACGSRTLVKSAAACIDISTMPLTVTFVMGDPPFPTAALSGTFQVFGTQFAAGNSDLELVLGGFHIHAQVSPDGVPINARIGPGESLGSLTIVTRS